MRAIVCSRYGPPESLRLVELPDPIPGPGELLIRVRATPVNSADSRIRALRMPSPLFSLAGRFALGFTGPRRRVLGTEAAGTVESIGPGVTRFRPGDSVVAVLGMRLGGHAELARVRESGPVIKKPESLSFEHAVAVPFGALTALYFLRDIARVSAGQRVLVVGASGSVGAAAVQIARHLGARVTAVCSTLNVETVRTLGAEGVIDYTRDDPFSRRAEFEAIFDTVGATTFARCKDALTPTGVFLPAVMTATEILQLLTTARSKGRRVRSGVTPERPHDLATVFDLVSSGALKPLIDRVYPLEDFVEAHRRVDSGRKVGSVVLSFPSPPAV
ncbi:MAG: NAD(P)-dependent alcohol dehydrogenase [Planctomycetes bacterium]|nr:NAD(P)-dependent alcohol dehydrogenase [Planctomycetota bacterium]